MQRTNAHLSDHEYGLRNYEGVPKWGRPLLSAAGHSAGFRWAAAAFPIFACRKKTDLLDGGRIHRKYLYSTTGTLIYRLIRGTHLQRRTNNCIGETEQYGRKNMANLTVTISKQH